MSNHFSVKTSTALTKGMTPRGYSGSSLKFEVRYYDADGKEHQFTYTNSHNVCLKAHMESQGLDYDNAIVIPIR